MFFATRDWLNLPLPQLQTLIFLMRAFIGQGNVYRVRTSRRLWQSRPSRWLLLASMIDMVAVSALAVNGVLMAALSPALVAELLAVVLIYLILLDFVKARLFRYFDLQGMRRTADGRTGY